MATVTATRKTVTKKAPINATIETIPIPEVTGYATDITFFATKYEQGTRITYSLDLTPAELVALIAEPDPARPSPGNRMIRLPHAQSFAKYLRDQPTWISPGMILRAPAMFNFEALTEIAGAQFGTLKFPVQAMRDLHILDGQHRILGMHLATKGIADDLDKARSALASARRVDPKSAAVRHAQEAIGKLEVQRKRLSKERLSLQIIVEEDVRAYRQAFFEIADNALGITASVKARFDSHKVVNRALEPVLEHPLLTGRVDPEGDRVGRGSPYLMGAKHVVEIIRTIKVGLDGRISRRQESEFKERDMAEKTKEFLTVVQQSFPQMQALTLGQLLPNDLRNTSLLGSVLMMRVLGGVYHDLIEAHAFSKEMVADFFTKLAPHMSGAAHPDSIWMTRLEGVFTDGGMAPHGRRQDLKYINDVLVSFAIEKPDWLNEAPKERVYAEEDTDLLEGAGYKENPLELLAQHE